MVGIINADNAVSIVAKPPFGGGLVYKTLPAGVPDPVFFGDGDGMYLKQVSDGTGAVVDDLDPVAHLTCAFGTGGVIKQATDSYRLTYRKAFLGGNDALEADGTDDYLASADDLGWGSGHTQGSIAVWLRPHVLNSGDFILTGYNGATKYYDVQIDTSNRKSEWEWRVSGGIQGNLGLTNELPASANVWFHLGATYDTGTGEIWVYVGGAVTRYITGMRTGSFDAVTSWRVGEVGANGPFDGEWDDLLIFKTKLTTANFAALAAARL